MHNLAKIEIDPDTFLKQQHTLPPLPEIVTSIQQIIVSENANVNNISDLITRDPSLTAQVLKTVNSAYYGFKNEITDIKFAVAYLGIYEIYNMVLSYAVVGTLKVQETRMLDSFWTHSIFSALCAKFLAKKFEPLIAPEKIWIGALLHDIGKLVYYKFFPGHYQFIIEHAAKNGQLYRDTEKNLPIPPSHTLGTLLCKRWNLPTMISDACEAHTFDINDGSVDKTVSDFKKIIYGANLMAVLASGDLSDETKKRIFKRFTDVFNISEGELLELMGNIYDLKLEVTKFKW